MASAASKTHTVCPGERKAKALATAKPTTRPVKVFCPHPAAAAASRAALAGAATNLVFGERYAVECQQALIENRPAHACTAAAAKATAASALSELGLIFHKCVLPRGCDGAAGWAAVGLAIAVDVSFIGESSVSDA